MTKALDKQQQIASLSGAAGRVRQLARSSGRCWARGPREGPAADARGPPGSGEGGRSGDKGGGGGLHSNRAVTAAGAKVLQLPSPARDSVRGQPSTEQGEGCRVGCGSRVWGTELGRLCPPARSRRPIAGPWLGRAGAHRRAPLASTPGRTWAVGSLLAGRPGIAELAGPPCGRAAVGSPT